MGAKEAITPNINESRGHEVSIYMFVDADLVVDKSTRIIQTGVFIFINKYAIHWYSKIHATVKASTFGEEFCSMTTDVEMVESLCYKLRMFGVQIDGSTNVFCDNEVFYKNTITTESVLNKKHHSIYYQRCRDAVAAKTIRVANQGNEKNPSDLFSKIMTASRIRFLLEKFTY